MYAQVQILTITLRKPSLTQNLFQTFDLLVKEAQPVITPQLPTLKQAQTQHQKDVHD